MTRLSARGRAAVELSALAVLTPLYLVLVPGRPIWVDLALALLAVLFVLATARDTRERFWPPSAAPPSSRRSAMTVLVAGTVLGTAVFAALAVWWIPADPAPGARGLSTVLRPAAVLATLVLFVPWALLQQTLFQFYLLGRLRALAPPAPAAAPVVANALAFGLVHLPDLELTALTVLAGLVWSWCYLTDRRLVPIALSHATLGTAYYAWARGQDLAADWLRTLGAW